MKRPFSIFDFNKKEKSITILYRVVGKGTKQLSTLSTGTELDVLGPLGDGFTVDIEEDNILLIGGGMGIAPLFFLAKKLSSVKKQKNIKAKQITALLGAANKEEIILS